MSGLELRFSHAHVIHLQPVTTPIYFLNAYLGPLNTLISGSLEVRMPHCRFKLNDVAAYSGSDN